MRFDNASGAFPAFRAMQPNGRLFVPPAYYNTGSDTPVQLNAANDWVAQKIIPECDFLINSIRTYITAVATQGYYTIDLYTHDATNNKPGSKVVTMVLNQDCGASADEWIWSAASVQLYRSNIYWIVFKGTDGDDFSLSCNRWNTVIGSMFPDSMPEAKVSTDGGSTWSALTVDSKPACLNMAINPFQIFYGRHNGKWIHVPGSGMLEIPITGVYYPTGDLEDSTNYYLFLQNYQGTPYLSQGPSPPISSQPNDDGFLVDSSYPTLRYVGMVRIKTLSLGSEGPVDVMDSRLVRNHYNEPEVMIGKANPYSSDTAMTLSAGSWRSFANNGDDFRCDFLAMPGEILQVVAGDLYVMPAGSEVYVDMGIGVDSKTPNEYSASTGIRVNSADVRQSMSAYYNGPVAAGVHSVWPVAYISSTSLAIGLRNTYAGNIQFAWHGRVGK